MIVILFILSLVNFNSPAILGGKVDLVFFIIFIFFLAAAYTDHLDGSIARKRNMISDLGKFLDPVADKLLVNSMVIFLVAPSIFSKYNTVQTVNFSVWCAIILVARDIVVDSLRFIAAQKGQIIAANKYGKLKTVAEMVAICLVLLNGWPFSYFDANWPVGLHMTDLFIYFATICSVFSGIIYLIQNKHVFKSK